MADNTTLNTGAGGDTIATDDIAGVKHQYVKVEFGVADTATPVSAANPLPVDQTNTTVADGGTLPAKGVQIGGTDGSVFQVMSTDNAGRPNVNVNGTVPVSAAALPLPAGASTAAKQPALGTAGTASADVISVQGVASMTPLKVDGSGVTQPVSGTVTASGPLTDAQLRASAPSVDTELPAAAALADAAANPTTPTLGSAGLLWNGTTWDRAKGDTTNGAFVNVKAMIALPTGSNVIGALTANQSVNAAQVAGTATSVNSGVKDAGTQRVVIATDQVALTNALKVDGSATTQPVNGTVTANLAAAAGAAGLTKFHLVSAGSTNATNVKASAGKLHGWYIYNSNAAARKVAFHNTAGSPTAGTAVTDSIVIPPTSAANAFTDIGIAFATGIAITTVTDLTDAGATAVAANDLVINLYYI